MTYEEIQSKLSAIVREMMDKDIPSPDATFCVKANGRPYVYLDACEKVFPNSQAFFFCYADTPEGALSEAQSVIRAMISGEEKIMRTYLGKLADAVDYGHSNGIAAEYVDPVRITQKAMTENLLPKPEVLE